MQDRSETVTSLDDALLPIGHETFAVDSIAVPIDASHSNANSLLLSDSVIESSSQEWSMYTIASDEISSGLRVVPERLISIDKTD